MRATLDHLRTSALSLLTFPSSLILPSLPHLSPRLYILFSLIALLLLYILYLRLPSLATLCLQALCHTSPVPSHVAFIMDGNRRWARRSNLHSHQGHPAGGEKLLESLQWCLDAGIQIVTVYAFSVENFKRSATEVSAIFDLAARKFEDDFSSKGDIIHQRRVRVRVLGDLSLIPPDLRASMASVMLDTAQYTDGLVLNICFAYAARRDMAMAVKEVARLAKEEGVPPDEIDEAAVAACLSSGFARGGLEEEPPQLLVRTSGETRLSDFLLWEAEDAVLSFSPVLWPDLNAWDFVHILFDYQRQCGARDKWRESRGVDGQGVRVDLKVNANMRAALEKARARYFAEIEDYCKVEPQ